MIKKHNHIIFIISAVITFENDAISQADSQDNLPDIVTCHLQAVDDAARQEIVQRLEWIFEPRPEQNPDEPALRPERETWLNLDDAETIGQDDQGCCILKLLIRLVCFPFCRLIRRQQNT